MDFDWKKDGGQPMTKYFCDRCGKQIRCLENVCGVVFEEKGETTVHSERVEVCYDCMKRIRLVAKRKDAPAEDE